MSGGVEAMMLQEQARAASPTIFVCESEFDELDRIAGAQRSRAAALLRHELDRAVVLADSDGDGAPAFVRLGARVEYLELPSGRTRAFRLVRPQHANIEQGDLSVLTQVGAALLGLSTGDSFSLTMEDGRERVLVVTQVEAS